MKPIALAMLLLLFSAAQFATAQDAASFLLARANSLRAARGLPAYAVHPALAAAADNHARWMAENNRVAHVQFDGADVRTRAQAAGFPSSWVGENIYLGTSASPEAAWNWWLNSPVHFAGLVSPNFDKIGIGSASVGGRTAFVLVFGNSQGRLSSASGSSASSGDAPVNRPRSFAVGLDEYGNIKHEVQPGHTIGDIALIYGYTWDDIPAMLALNNLTWDDIRYLQPGEVFLVPPQDGTFTPTSAAPTATATAPATHTASATDTPIASAATPSPTSALRIDVALAPTPGASDSRANLNDRRIWAGLLPLGAAILVQLGIIGVASLELLRRSR
ncbi:MAG: hypothetical protein F4X02_03495 [Chloroflexi bacterium]|nr:hypothetical protein [Chloroflexota bacterium]